MNHLQFVKVIFACPLCTSAYRAVQRPYFGFGSFDCWDCGVEIYRWSGNYVYTDWDQIATECKLSFSGPQSD